jgi:hypothetical protein
MNFLICKKLLKKEKKKRDIAAASQIIQKLGRRL